MTALGLALFVVGWTSLKLQEPFSRDSYTLLEVASLLALIAGFISFWIGVVMYLAKAMP
jgi:hypothetical protein